MPLGGGGGSGGGGSAGAIRAGRAFVEFLGNEGPLAKAAMRAKAIVQGFGKAIGTVGKVAGVAGAALFAPLTALFMGGVNYAAQLDDLADSFGTTVEKLGPGAAAFKVAGLGLEDFSTALKEVAKDGGTGPIEDQLDSLMEKMQAIEDPAERARFALDKFGKAGVKMAAIAPDWDRLKSQAPKVSSEDAKKAEQVQQAFAAAMLSLQVALLPILDIVTPIIKAISDFVKENSAAVTVLAGVAAGLLAFSAAMTIVSAALGGVSMVLGGVVGLLGIVKFALLALLSPIGLVVGGIAAIGVVFATQSDIGKESMSRLKAGFVESANTAKEAWGGIVAAMKKGDMQLAMQIVGASLRFEWAKIDAYWTRQWGKFKDFFVDGWHSLGFAISRVWNSVTTGLELALVGVMRGVVWIFNNTIGQIVKAAAWLLDKVGAKDTAKSLREFSKVGTEGLDKWQNDIMENDAKKAKDIDERQRKLMEANKQFREERNAMAEAEVRAADEERKRLLALAHEPGQPKAGESGYKLGGQKPEFKFAEATKGLFQSPNFQAALGIADKVNDKALKQQEAMARNTKMIVELLRIMPFAHFK